MNVWIDEWRDVVWNGRDENERLRHEPTDYLIDGVSPDRNISQECGLWMILR